MRQLALYSNNDEYCKTNDGTMISVGDVARLPCENGLKGVMTRRCVEGEKGMTWKTEQEYCSEMKVKSGRGWLRFGLSVNGVRYDKIEETEGLVVKGLAQLLKVDEAELSVYYLYYRIDAEPFCYMELYVECQTSAWRGNQVAASLRARQGDIARRIATILKKDIFVSFLKEVYYVHDYRLLLGVGIGVTVVIGGGGAWILVVLLSRKRREKELNDLLMCWCVCWRWVVEDRVIVRWEGMLWWNWG